MSGYFLSMSKRQNGVLEKAGALELDHYQNPGPTVAYLSEFR